MTRNVTVFQQQIVLSKLKYRSDKIGRHCFQFIVIRQYVFIKITSIHHSSQGHILKVTEILQGYEQDIAMSYQRFQEQTHKDQCHQGIS